jgi:hypothetical protein
MKRLKDQENMLYDEECGLKEKNIRMREEHKKMLRDKWTS